MTATAALPFYWKPCSASPLVLTADAARGRTPPGTLYQGVPGKESLQTILVGRAAFSAAECAEIVRMGTSRTLRDGEMLGGAGEQRRCLVSWVEEDAASAWIYARIRDFVLEANASFEFELAGFGEPLHFLEYVDGGHIGWHTDVYAGPNSTRKLSVSVQLSRRKDYDGGELELFPQGVVEEFLDQGDIAVFPAYMPHRVRPVSRGTRHAFVAWLHGPAFR